MKKVLLGISMSIFISYTALAQSKKTKTVTKARPVSRLASTASGKAVYAKYCLTCHQSDGGGVQNMNPPLIKTDYVLGDKTRLIRVLLHGLNKEIEINGDTYVNPMPAHDFLKDQEIADALTYIRSNFGNKASAVSSAEVKKVRAGSKTDPDTK